MQDITNSKNDATEKNVSFETTLTARNATAELIPKRINGTVSSNYATVIMKSVFVIFVSLLVAPRC